MKFDIKKEIPLILLSVLPAFFLIYIWSSLPNQVPLHWDINGEVNRYGDVWELLLLVFMPIFLYILFLFIPSIDPKKRMESMGNKYYSIRLITGIFISVLFLFILYSVKDQNLLNPNYMFIIIGAFFMMLGNYFTTIKPNYFVGIRTPWTLENETVWKKTHRLAAKLWVPGGLLIVASGFIFDEQTTFIIFFVVTSIIALIPVIYSYILYRQEKQKV